MAYRQDVRHRIDGLEIADFTGFEPVIVRHRIDGLETTQ